MTKPLDPEIKALRAMLRAIKPLDPRARKRAVDWLYTRIKQEDPLFIVEVEEATNE